MADVENVAGASGDHDDDNAAAPVAGRLQLIRGWLQLRSHMVRDRCGQFLAWLCNSHPHVDELYDPLRQNDPPTSSSEVEPDVPGCASVIGSWLLSGLNAIAVCLCCIPVMIWWEIWGYNPDRNGGQQVDQVPFHQGVVLIDPVIRTHEWANDHLGTATTDHSDVFIVDVKLKPMDDSVASNEQVERPIDDPVVSDEQVQLLIDGPVARDEQVQQPTDDRGKRVASDGQVQQPIDKGKRAVTGDEQGEPIGRGNHKQLWTK